MSAAPRDGAFVLGIDGGNSKVDVALARVDGTLLAARRGPTISHQQRDLAPALDELHELTREVCDEAAAGDAAGTRPVIALTVASLAGADYPEDVRLLRAALERLELSDRVVVVNDTIGALRAGASRPWGIGLVCGQGINASAIAPDGRRTGFPAVGDIAGDWGGGTSLGMAALAAAVRGRDGRGPHTSLEQSVPRFFGLRRPADVTHALYRAELAGEAQTIAALAPLVFDEAAAGDAAARAIVERLATELAGMATALMRRLGITRLDTEVVLAGGVFRTEEPGFYASLERDVLNVAPQARFVRLGCPPVVGAILLAIEELTGVAASGPLARGLRDALRSWDRNVRAT
jgi:N-acetylglucosamine kinase-like BadF-type ATPase